jgi:TolB-like protein/DNA-binding winged helix-turn-helix (wHTH) protein/Tfp pilus assembly protein PilF
MQQASQPERVVRFGAFELNLHSGELRKQGVKVKLQEQPFRVLVVLLEHPGEVVTREELRTRLWPQDTFVDFEHSLATAINKVREALGDAVQSPRFIETLPRRGYRFIAPVAALPAADSLLAAPPTQGNGDIADAGTRIAKSGPLEARWIIAAAASVLVAVGIVIALNVANLRERLMKIAGARHELPVPKIDSVAVLPLENLSRDPEQEYFADGMTDALITDLAQIHALRVISRNSVMQYKHNPKTTPQIARELNVDAVVEGTVTRSGDRVRITAQLIAVPEERHLWADTYESDLRDVLSLQDEIARAIAAEVKATLTPREQASLSNVPSINPQAHDAYLRGRFYYDPYKDSLNDLPRAIQYMQQAIQIDPNYAPAYAILAADYYDSSESRSGNVPDTEAAQKATATALKALQLDNSVAEAHVVLGAVHDGHDWDWAGAEREFKRAIDLDPSLVPAYVGYAWHLTFVDRPDEAIREVNRTVELDPVSSYALESRNLILYMTRHYNEAIEQGHRWLELFPNSSDAYDDLAPEFEATGMYDQEVTAMQKALTLKGEPAGEVTALGQAYKKGGIRGVWQWDLERMKKEAGQGKVHTYHLMELYSLLGEKDKAIENLEKLYSRHGQDGAIAKIDPRCDNLRSDPRYQDIIHRMNFPR